MLQKRPCAEMAKSEWDIYIVELQLCWCSEHSIYAYPHKYIITYISLCLCTCM